MAKSKGSSMSRLSKKLVSLALVATMMGGTGAVVGTVASMSNLPVNAVVSVSLKNSDGALQTLSSGTVFTANGITYKVINVGTPSTNSASETLPTLRVMSLDASYFAGKTSLKFEQVKITYKNSSGKQASTYANVSEIGDGTNPICPSAISRTFKSVSVPSSVEKIAANAFKDMFVVVDADAKDSAMPTLQLGDKNDLYGLKLTSFDTTGMPTYLTVSTYCLNLPESTTTSGSGSTQVTKITNYLFTRSKTGSSNYTYTYSNTFKSTWNFKAYWGSYVWAQYLSRFSSVAKDRFSPIAPVSLKTGVKDAKTGATFAFYLSSPTSSSVGIPSSSFATSQAYYMHAVGPFGMDGYSVGGIWYLTGANTGSNEVGGTANAYGTGLSTYYKDSCTVGGTPVDVDFSLASVAEQTIDIYNKTITIKPKVGVGALSDMVSWNMSKELVIDNTTSATAAAKENAKNVVELFTRKDIYSVTAPSSGTTAVIGNDLSARVGNNAGLGYLLSGDYGTGLLLLSANGYAHDTKYYTGTTYNSGTGINRTYSASTIPATTTSGKYITNVSFGKTACSVTGYNPLPLSGTYSLVYNTDILAASTTVAYVDYSNSGVDSTTSKAKFTLNGLVPGYTYQLLYTTTKTSGYDNNVGTNFDSKWLNSWKVVSGASVTNATADTTNSKGKFVLAANASTATLTNCFTMKADTAYYVCLKTFDINGKEIRKSYGVIGANEMKSYSAATDVSTNNRPKNYGPTSLVKVYKKDAASSDAATMTGATSLVPTFVVNVTANQSTAFQGSAPVYTYGGTNYSNTIHVDMKPDIYIVSAAGSVVMSTTALTKSLGAIHYSLFSNGASSCMNNVMWSWTPAKADFAKLADGKYVVYATEPYYTPSSGTSYKLSIPGATEVAGVATGNKVKQIATFQISSLGFKLAKTQEKCDTGVVMSINSNGMTLDKYYLQEYVGSKWSDITVATTKKDVNGTVVNLASTGFTAKSASILPKVGTHKYRIKAIAKSGPEIYSNVQTITITSGFNKNASIKVNRSTITAEKSTVSKKTDGTTITVYTPKTKIKTFVLNSDGYVAVDLNKLTNADVYGRNTSNITTSAAIYNGTVAETVEYGEWVGAIVDKTSVTTSNIIQSNSTSTAVSSNGTLNYNSFRIKAVGTYLIEMTTSFTDTNGATVSKVEYVTIRVTK